MSEVLKLRSAQAGLKIARAVNVLPRVAPSQKKHADARQHATNADMHETYDQSGGFVGGEDLERGLRAEFERGTAEGQRRAEDMMRAEVTAGLQSEHQRIEKFLTGAAEQWSGLYAASEEATVRFAFGVAERIIRKELSQDPSIVVEQIKEGIRRVLGVESVKIRVHPEDLPLVREQKGAIQSSGDALREIVVEGDESLEQGDCIIESDMGNIDARISTQLKQIENVLFESKVVS